MKIATFPRRVRHLVPTLFFSGITFKADLSAVPSGSELGKMGGDGVCWEVLEEGASSCVVKDAEVSAVNTSVALSREAYPHQSFRQL